VPAPLRKRPMMNASFPDRSREHRTEPVPPEPNRLVADIDAPLMEQIFDLSQRKRIADIHHHREADHLRRRVEITEGVLHSRRLKNLARRLKPIYSDNALPHASRGRSHAFTKTGFFVHGQSNFLRGYSMAREVPFHCPIRAPINPQTGGLPSQP